MTEEDRKIKEEMTEENYYMPGMAREDGLFLDERIFDEYDISPVCGTCKHDDRNAIRKCAAFDRIPDEIWEGRHRHRTPYPGDGGIRYEKFRFEEE